MLSDDFPELSACLDRFQTTIEFNCSPYVSVAEEPSNRFVISWMMFQIDGGGGVPKLVERDPQCGCLLIRSVI